MIVPSIDLMDGQAVQLVGGRDKALDAGDPLAVAERFAVVGELAVIDLDAALGRGSNRDVMLELVRRHPCRVGGGIRTVDQALEWLDAGARKVILGTAATPEVLTQLPRDRVIAALDGVDGEVVVRGWTERTGASVLDRLAELNRLVGGFLVTFVEREGRLGGIDLEAARRVVEAAAGTRVTIAGGVTTDRRGGRPRPPGRRRPDRDGDLHRPARSRRRLRRTAGLRPPRRSLADRGLRRARDGARAGLLVRRQPARGGRRAARRLLVALALRAVAQGRDFGRRPGAGAGGGRLRPRRAALHRASTGRVLSPRHPLLLGR